MVLRGIGGEDGRDARIEAAAEDRRESRSLEAVLIGPLPRILEMRLVLRLVVGRVEVVATAFEAGIHDRQVLIGQRHVDHDVGFECPEQLAELGHAVGIDLGGLHPIAADGCSDGIAFGFGAARQHHVGEDGVGGDLLRNDRAYASGTDNKRSTHIESIFIRMFSRLQKYRFISAIQKYAAEFFARRTLRQCAVARPRRFGPRVGACGRTEAAGPRAAARSGNALLPPKPARRSAGYDVYAASRSGFALRRPGKRAPVEKKRSDSCKFKLNTYLCTTETEPRFRSAYGESVAQQVEHNTFNVGVLGSSPSGFTESYLHREDSFFIMGGSHLRLPPRRNMRQ